MISAADSMTVSSSLTILLDVAEKCLDVVAGAVSSIIEVVLRGLR